MLELGGDLLHLGANDRNLSENTGCFGEFLRFPLCVSRACLGKVITFDVKNWTTVPFSYYLVRVRALRDAPTRNEQLFEKKVFVSAFVPSLSWQTIPFSFLFVPLSTDGRAPHPQGRSVSSRFGWADLERDSSVGGSSERTLQKKTHLFLECFPYVCPEPVLLSW
jgi:hypothetical protein